MQVSYHNEVEEKLQSLKAEHVHKVQSLTRELEKFKYDQAQQLREVSQLKDVFTKTSSEQIKELKQQHDRELRRVRDQAENERELLKTELDSQAMSHERELKRTRQEYEAKLRTVEENLSNVQGHLLSEERKKREEEMRAMQDDYSQREEQLKNQISVLTKDLRSSKDKLALAEQRIKELETTSEESMADSSGLRAQLRESEGKVTALQASVDSLQTELDIVREQYRQQSKEMQGMSGELKVYVLICQWFTELLEV